MLICAFSPAPSVPTVPFTVSEVSLVRKSVALTPVSSAIETILMGAVGGVVSTVMVKPAEAAAWLPAASVTTAV